MTTDIMPENPAPGTGTPVPVVPVPVPLLRDSFVVYAMVAVAMSFPFSSLVMFSSPLGMSEVSRFVWLCLLVPIIVLGLLDSALLILPIRLPVFGSRGNKIMNIVENSAKWFVVLYGLSLIVLALLSLTRHPCAGMVVPAMVGCGINGDPFYIFFCQFAKLLLGFGIGGSMIRSAMFLETNNQRWRLLRWSCFLWLLLGGVWGVGIDKGCAISCSQVKNYGQ
jgi:hypothetical protein